MLKKFLENKIKKLEEENYHLNQVCKNTDSCFAYVCSSQKFARNKRRIKLFKKIMKI